jgi:hypothetical protein
MSSEMNNGSFVGRMFFLTQNYKQLHLECQACNFGSVNKSRNIFFGF